MVLRDAMMRLNLEEQPHVGDMSEARLCASPRQERVELLVLAPSRSHLLLKEVYGEHLHHNEQMHLYGGVTDNSLWQRF